MKMLLSVSAPMLVPDTDFEFDDNPVRQAHWVQKLLGKKSCRPLCKYKGFELNVTGRDGPRSYIFAEGLLPSYPLAYIMRLQNRTIYLNGVKTPTVVELIQYRNSAYPESTGISDFVFWNHLYPKHSLVMSDGKHTRASRLFWGRQIVQAIDQGIHVYLYDQIAKTCTPITKVTLHTLPIWGPHRKFYTKRILISKNEVHTENTNAS